MSRLHAKSYDSLSHDYTTPEDFIDLHLNFLGRKSYDIDAACLYANIPADVHFMPYIQPWSMSLFGDLPDGLKQKWEGCVYINPPYGKLLAKFVKKAVQEVQDNDCEVWILLPTRFTQYYIELIYRTAGFVYFMPEKSFEFLINGQNKGKAPMPVCLAYLGNYPERYIQRWLQDDPFENTRYKGVLMSKLRGMQC